MARYTYGFSRDIDIPFSDAIKVTAQALQAEGFSVTQIDKPKPQTNGKVEPFVYAILDACDLALFEKSISFRPDLGLLTTCRAVICANEKGITLCISDPYQTLGQAGGMPPLDGIIEELNGRLWSVYLRVILSTVAGSAPLFHAENPHP